MLVKDFIEKYQIPYIPIFYYIHGVSKNKMALGEMNNMTQEEIIIHNDKIENYKIDKNIDQNKHVAYSKNKNEFYEQKKNYFPSYSLYLKYTDIICLDIDDESIKDINDLNDNFNFLKNTIYIKGNKKGIHIYFKIKNLPEYKNEKKIGLDYELDLIKNKNNMWERKDKTVFNTELLTIDFSQLSQLLNLEKMNIQNKPIIKEIKPTNQIIDNIQPQKLTEKIDQLLDEILKNLNIKRCQDFDLWMNIGFSLKPYNNFNLWVEFSKRCIESFNKNKDNLNYMFQQWSRFRKNNCYNLYSLLKWLKEDNKEVVDNIYEKYNEIIEENKFYLSNVETTNYIIKNVFNNRIYYIEEDIFYIFNYDTNLYDQIDNITLRNYILVFLENFIKQNNIKLEIKMKDKLLGNNNIKKIVENIENKCINKIIYDQLDNIPNVLNFKNGLLDLKTLKFRSRNEDDYFSKCLNYNYNENVDINLIEEIKQALLLNFNNDEDILNDILTFYGYAITGEKDKSDVLFNIGYGGGNGKTTISQILLKYVLKEYCNYTNGETFLLGIDSNNRSKFLSKLQDKTRLLFIEEFDEMKLDIAFIKELSGSDYFEHKPLFSKKSINIKHYIKMSFIGNKDPNFKSDTAMNRRGRLIYYNNKFVSKKEYDEAPDKKNLYIADTNYLNKFENDDYKNAFIQLLIKYSKLYYDTNSLNYKTDISKAFEEVNENNNPLELFLNDNIEFTNNKNDCINKQELLNAYLGYNQYKIKLLITDFLKEMRKYKDKFYSNYDKQKYKNGKGCYIGMKFKDEVNNNDIDL